MDAPGATTSAKLCEQAEELARSGRFLAAAALLEGVVAREGGDDLAAPIVRYRHLGFRELRATTQQRPSWPPPTGPDRFPGLTGAPEVRASELTPELLANAVRHHGCLLVRGLFPPERADQLCDAVDRAFDALTATNGRKGRFDPNPWHTPLELDEGYEVDPLATMFLLSAGGVYAGTSPRAFVDFLEAARESGVVSVIGQYLGEPPVVSLNKCVLRRVSDGAAPSWHQDGFYLGVDIRAIDLWVALSDCGADSGAMGLEILPRPMHGLAEMGGPGAIDYRAVSQRVIDQLADEAGVQAQVPHFQPGDAMLFDQLFLHRTDPRPLERTRYAIESWFFAPSTYPDNQVPLAAV